MFDRYACNRFCLSLFGVLCYGCVLVLSKLSWSVVFDRYGCNRSCLSLFGVLCFTVTAVIGSL